MYLEGLSKTMKHLKLVQPVSGQRVEHGNLQIPSRDASHLHLAVRMNQLQVHDHKYACTNMATE